MRLALYPLVQQFQYRNGTNLVAGKIYVYYRGRTRLATIYKDQNGTIAQNPLTCDADGRAPCFVDTNYQYTIVVCDARGKELFSQDLDADNAININDALSGDSKLYIINSDGTISVNATSGDTWIQYDLGTFNKPLGVIEPLYWQQDDEEASIIGLHTEGLVSGISADFTELSGKVDELTGDVSYLSGASDYLSGVVEQKMDKSMSSEFYPSDNPSGFIGDEGLSNYQPVSGMSAYQEKGNYYSASNPSGFITGVDLSDYAKTEDLTAYQAKGDYYSASNPSGFINSDAISSMATTGFVADVSADITAMIPTALTGDYLTKESADTLYQPIGDYATNTDLQTVSGEITAMIPTALTGDYLDKASADTLYYGINNPSGFITGVDLDPYQTKEDMTAYQPVGNYQTAGDYQSAGDYYSASNPSGFITGVDLSNYYEKNETSSKEEISAAIAEASTAAGKIYEGVAPIVVNNDENKISADMWEFSAGEGISIVDNQYEQKTVISITGAFDKASADTLYYGIDNPSGFITGVDLSDYTTTADLESVSSDLHNDIVDLSGKIPSANYELSADKGISIVDDDELSSTYIGISGWEYDDEDRISGFCGSSFAGQGGGDVPEGVMSESGLEYNAVNEISGYNGSAIAQYGAEKQWLTHDDTLVHLSNSAQYALGVNLSGISSDLASALGTNYDIDKPTFAGWYDSIYPIYQQAFTAAFSIGTTYQTPTIISRVGKPWEGKSRYWIDPSNSYIYYGSYVVHLPISWMLGDNRWGSICMVNSGDITHRGRDAAATNLTARINVKWVEGI